MALWRPVAVRTLSQRFILETGFTVTQWRQQAKLPLGGVGDACMVSHGPEETIFKVIFARFLPLYTREVCRALPGCRD